MIKNKFTFNATGTLWEIDYSGNKNKLLEKEIITITKNFELRYSRFLENSFINKISTKPGNYKLTKTDLIIFNTYGKLYKATKGAFSPLIGASLISAGYTPDYKLKKIKPLISIPKLSKVFKITNSHITILKPFNLDFGGVGKGLLIDKITKLLFKYKLSSFNVNGGGDMFIYNRANINTRVGLEHPYQLNKVIGHIDIVNCSICASSTNRRSWGKYSHIINAKTNKSPKKIISTWIIAKNALIADSIATCIFFSSPSSLLKHYNFEYLILYNNYRITKSRNFNATLFYD